MIFTSKIVAYSYKAGQTFAANNLGSDLYLGVKSNQSVTANYRFVNAKFVALECVVEDTVIARLFVDFVNDEFYGDNLTFNVTAGTAINESSSTYDVVVNGVTIGTVTNNTYAKA